MKWFSFLVLFFLVLWALVIISNGNLHLAKHEDMNIFLKSYSTWLYHLVDNFFNVLGYVVRLDWHPLSIQTSVP